MHMKKTLKALCGLFVIMLFSGCKGEVLFADNEGIFIAPILFAICAIVLYCYIKPKRKKKR